MPLKVQFLGVESKCMNFPFFAIIVLCLSLAACGPGGSATGSSSGISGSLAVQATSYGNKNVAGLTTTAVPIDAVTDVILVAKLFPVRNRSFCRVCHIYFSFQV